MTDRSEQMAAIRDGMLTKATQLMALTSQTDKNGHRRQAVPQQPTQHTYEDVSPEQRIEAIDRLLDNATEPDKAALLGLREQAIAEVDPGPGDGGAREPLPATSLQEQADQAAANGDTATAMSIKSQLLGQIIQRRNEGN